MFPTSQDMTSTPFKEGGSEAGWWRDDILPTLEDISTIQSPPNAPLKEGGSGA